MTTDDPFLEQFFKEFGDGERYRPLTDECAARLAKTMPEVFVDLLKQNGFCSYQDQMLWMCDPLDWMDAAKAWMPDTENPQVFARTSFGDLYIWDGERCWAINVNVSLISEKMNQLGAFLGFGLTDKEYWEDGNLLNLTRQGLEKTGKLTWDEIYMWTPALALGGSESSSKLSKSPAVAGLIMLAGIQRPSIQKF